MAFLPVPYAPDPRFTVLPGVVEIDTLPATHAVTIWNVRNGDEVLEAGIPVYQMVPFKRSTFLVDIKVIDNKDEWSYYSRIGKGSVDSKRIIAGGYRQEIKRKKNGRFRY